MTDARTDKVLDAYRDAHMAKLNAQAAAWKATDLLAQHVELILEKHNLTEIEYIRALDKLLIESRAFLLTSPAYSAQPLMTERP